MKLGEEIRELTVEPLLWPETIPEPAVTPSIPMDIPEPVEHT